jgi:hypothetical protein
MINSKSVARAQVKRKRDNSSANKGEATRLLDISQLALIYEITPNLLTFNEISVMGMICSWGLHYMRAPLYEYPEY